MRLGSTSHLRSARAEALFRRLRFDKHDQIADALTRAPRRIDAADIDGSPSAASSVDELVLSKAMKISP